MLASLAVNRKTIATNAPIVSCDVCGRTLLRGENADVFLHAGSRRTVCELCTSRAMHEGWIREGLEGAMPGRTGERGSGARSLLHRLRGRRESRGAPEPARAPEPVAFEPEPGSDSFFADESPVASVVVEPVMPELPVVPEPLPPPVAAPAHPSAVHAPAVPSPAPPSAPAGSAPRQGRNVHAVPTNAELKVGRALELFNGSSHPRTVAGVTRSLGAPIVSARPSVTEGSIVTIVVGWELSWYRYEVDLGDEGKGVRVAGQGTELSELDPEDQRSNALADDRGALRLSAGVA